ncbi:hypothetical protein KR222_005124, partial [Zaprionus bogoriensis]
MQNCLFTDYRFSPSEMRVRMAIAAATPTTTRRGHRVALFTDAMPTPAGLCHLPGSIMPLIGAIGHLDGVYDVSPKLENLTSLKLLQYLKLARDNYKLKDYDAMELLGFFKCDLSEACRHLANDGRGSNMLLDLDTPWRLQAKTIRESPGMKHMAAQKFYTNYQQIFIIDSSYLMNVLPQQPMAEQFAGRDVRIQRTFHGGDLLQVGCVLASEQEPFEVACLLLRSSDRNQLPRYTQLIDQLENYLAPLIMASKTGT